jgi:RNase H-fold protein (predicted Holliday junction resolvase)
MIGLTEKIVVAIDPGSSKVGMALVKRTEANEILVIERTIATTETWLEVLHTWTQSHNVAQIILGNGTRHKVYRNEILAAMPTASLLTVDETNSTYESRAKYWEHNPRTGWRIFLPASMQYPPVPFDDFAALVLAEKVLTD